MRSGDTAMPPTMKSRAEKGSLGQQGLGGRGGGGAVTRL